MIGDAGSVDRTIGRQPKSAVAVPLTDTALFGLSELIVLGTQSCRIAHHDEDA